MCMPSAPFHLVCIALLLPRLASGQAIANLTAGAHVRITAAKHQLEEVPARLAARRADTLVVQIDTAALVPLTLTLGEIENLDVQQGYDHRKGVQVGDLVGILVGGTVGYLVGSTRRTGDFEIVSPALWDSMIGVGIGGVLGMTLGWFLAPEHWVKVALPPRPR